MVKITSNYPFMFAKVLKWSVPFRKWPNPAEAELTDSRTTITLHGRVCVCVCVRACACCSCPPFLPVRCIS